MGLLNGWLNGRTLGEKGIGKGERGEWEGMAPEGGLMDGSLDTVT